jgi:hypothetical protein
MKNNDKKVMNNDLSLGISKEEIDVKTEAKTPDQFQKTKSSNFLSTYANMFQVSANTFDISVMFSSITMGAIEDRVFIQMSPKTVKKLYAVLQKVITDWEKDLKDD